MATYYAEFARGGFGLILSEGIFPDETFGRAYARQPGLVTPEQVAGWRGVTDAVHQAGGLIFAQLMHAGALSQCREHTIAPSSVQPKGSKMPEYGGHGAFPIPREMRRDDIDRALEGFSRAATLAMASGFDGIEVHGANGYLIDQFLTDYTNRRTDEYGGNALDRIRFACEVLRVVREAVGIRTVVGIRLSQAKVNDFNYRWPGGSTDAEVIFDAVRRAGASYIHVAGEGRSWRDSARLEPDGRTITQVARGATGIPVIANGALHDPSVAEWVLSNGHADLISVGRAALANPDWPARIRHRQGLESFDANMMHPEATIENADRWRETRQGSHSGESTQRILGRASADRGLEKSRLEESAVDQARHGSSEERKNPEEPEFR
jgi:2,4-dienoyl-CoA reductase-like NADH-dependent reductase (Old Yellow Enzyme family)